jgi:hypothetical protein
MNYKKIHDTFIESVLMRVHNSKIYQKHHIIPRHEDKTSTDVRVGNPTEKKLQ